MYAAAWTANKLMVVNPENPTEIRWLSLSYQELFLKPRVITDDKVLSLFIE